MSRAGFAIAVSRPTNFRLPRWPPPSARPRATGARAHAWGKASSEMRKRAYGDQCLGQGLTTSVVG
eukprot:597211-Pyramimonas_sp.AAC.1